jgi:cell division protein FtsN
MEKSYVEIKVSLIHIVVLLVGVCVIGAFLFYLGYQSGRSSARSELQASDLLKSRDKAEELKLTDDSDKPKKQEASIKDELRLHQLPTNNTSTSPSAAATSQQEPVQTEPREQKVEPRTVKKETYYAVQVGAFADYTNAQKYSTRFAGMGYPAEINPSDKSGKRLFRVWIGNFKTRADAQKDCDKLGKLENKKFSVVYSGTD